MLTGHFLASGSGRSDSDQKSTDEKILGEIKVVATLAMGVERLRLVFTTRRIIVARVGKRTGSGAPLTSIFGAFAAGLEDLFKGGRESLRKKDSQNGTPLKLLESDPDNSSILYSDVVTMEVQEDEGLTRITLVSKDEKYKFTSGVNVQRLREILGNLLGEKLSFSRTTQTQARRP
jgi:hypothetical protein